MKNGLFSNFDIFKKNLFIKISAMTGGFVRFSISLKINRPHKVGQINFILKWKAYDFKICTVTKNAFLFQDERCLGNPFFLKFHFSKLEGLLQIFHNASLGLQRGNLVFFFYPKEYCLLRKNHNDMFRSAKDFSHLGFLVTFEISVDL